MCVVYGAISTQANQTNVISARIRATGFEV